MVCPGKSFSRLLRDAECQDWTADACIPHVDTSQSLKMLNQDGSNQSFNASGTVAANSSESFSENIQPQEECKIMFDPQTLVEQQKKYLKGAATSKPSTGTASKLGKSNQRERVDAAGSKRSCGAFEPLSTMKKIKVEPSVAMHQLPVTPSPLTVAPMASNMGGKAAVPVDPNLVEQMLTNQKIMQQQIDNLNGD